MIVAVVVSMEGSLKSSLNRAANAIKKAKELINDNEHCTVYGPRFGKTKGQINTVHYRVSNGLRHIDMPSQNRFWDKKPDELVQG